MDWSLEGLYRHLHTSRIQLDHEVEKEMLVVWTALQDSERSAGRAIRDELSRFNKHSWVREATIFDTTSVEAMWRHLELAVRDGRWEALRRECPFGVASRACEPALVPVTDIPLPAIQRPSAVTASLDEAHRVLNAGWREQPLRNALLP